jgi:O-antigen/teichoic acid export membrane protein
LEKSEVRPAGPDKKWKYIDEPLKEKLKKNSFTNMLYFILTLPIMFVLTPFIIRYTGKEIYGVWALVGTLFVFVELITGIQTPTAIMVMIPKYDPKKNPEKINQVINTMFVFYVTTAIAMFVVYFFFRDEFIGAFFKVSRENLDTTVFIVSFSLYVLLLNFVVMSFCYLEPALNIIYIINTTHIITAYLRMASIIVVLVAGFGIKGVVVAQMSLVFLETLVILFYTKKIFPPLEISIKHFSINSFKEMMSLSLKFVVVKASTLVLWNADRLVIAYFINPVTVAVYQVGATIAKYVGTIPEMMGISSLLPAASELRSKNEHHKIDMMYRRVNKYMMFIALFFASGVILYGKEFTHLWLGKGFEDSFMVMAVLSASYIPGIMGYPAMNILNGMERIRETAIVSVISAVITVGLGIILTIKFGMNGMLAAAAISTVFSGITYYTLYVMITGSGFDLGDAFIKPIAAAVISFLPGYFIFMRFHGGTWIFLVIKIILFSVLYLFLCVIIFKHFDDYDINMVKGLIWPKKNIKGEKNG